MTYRIQYDNLYLQGGDLVSLHDRIKEARIKKGLTQEQLGELVGVAKTTITGYEKNREPTAAKVGEIADALNVDANFLYQDEVRDRKENNVSLEELSMIKKYRFISAHSTDGAGVVDTVLDMEYSIAEKLKERAEQIQNMNTETVPTRIINYYYRLASAGTGQIIFDTPPTKRIEIPDIPKYKHVDYAIGVNGVSMEPTYNDNDTLLVEMTDEVDKGEIGIFFVDNNCYVKKRGDKELISLNPNSPNVPMNESARCMGKVIDKLNKEE